MPRPDIEEWADDVFLGSLRCSKRLTFGCPSYYLGKSMLAFLYEDGLCIKLPAERAAKKIEEDSSVFGHFAPMGKPMKQWLLIVRPEAGEYETDMPLIMESVRNLHARGRNDKRSKVID